MDNKNTKNEYNGKVTINRFYSNIETDGLIKDNNGNTIKEVSWITPWSIMHILGGILFRGMGGSIYMLFLFHSLYEFIQHTDEQAISKWRSQGYPWFFGDSIENSLGDTVMALGGWAIFNEIIKMGKTTTLVFSVIFLIIGYLFLSNRVQNVLINQRISYLEKAYKLDNSNYKPSQNHCYLRIFGDKLPMPYALGLVIGLSLIIMAYTGIYVPNIIA